MYWGTLRLAARVFRPPAQLAGQIAGHVGFQTVLFVHGWTGSQDANDVALAAQLAEDGFGTMTFDLGGHGLSAGNAEDFTAADFLAQTVAAYDRLMNLVGVGQHTVSVCGTSLGAYLGVLLSVERPVSALSLRVPAHYPDDTFASVSVGAYARSDLPLSWRALPLAPNATRALRALRQFRGPVQIIEAARDEVIPRATIVNYLNAATRTIRGTTPTHGSATAPATDHSPSHIVLTNASHVVYADPVSRAEAFTAVRQWIGAQQRDRGMI